MNQVSNIVERWREATLATIRGIESEWFDASCVDLVNAILNNWAPEFDFALSEHAGVRSNHRWTLAEGLVDLEALKSVLDPDQQCFIDSLGVAVQYAEFWCQYEMQDFQSGLRDPLTQLPNFSYLRLRMNEFFERDHLSSTDEWHENLTIYVLRLNQHADGMERLSGRLFASKIIERELQGWPRSCEDDMFIAVAPFSAIARVSRSTARLDGVSHDCLDLPSTMPTFDRVFSEILVNNEINSY